MRAGGFPGNPGGLVVSIVKTAGARAPAHQARGRGRRTWRPTERTAGAQMVPPGEGNEARGDGRRGVGVSHSTAEAGELSPRDPVEGRGHRQVAPLEGKTANTPRLGPVSTSRQRIAELARQALGMAVAIAWLPGPAGTRRRVAKLSVEEPDAAEPARPDLWGARVSNDPGLPDLMERQERRRAQTDGDLPDPPKTQKEQPESAQETIAHRQVRSTLARTAQHDQLLLEQEILSDHGSHPAGSTELRRCDSQVEQEEQDSFHTRDSVGQTSGAMQCCSSSGFSERNGNSRRTGTEC